jgi:hypothetical protein
MRAREFITEEELIDFHSATLPHVKAYPDMPSSNPYVAYRFGMAMADHTIKHPNGPAKNSAVIAAYTRGEEEIIRRAEMKSGHRGNILADKGSQEPQGANTVSPVAKPKRNRYGI